MIVKNTDPEREFRTAEEKRDPVVQRNIPGEVKSSSIDSEEKTGNRLEHWLKKASISCGEGGVGKVPVVTSTDKVHVPSVANKRAAPWVRLPKVKTMINHVFRESEKERNSQVAEIAWKTVFDAMEMWGLEGQHGHVRSGVSLAIWSTAELNKGVVAGHMQQLAMRSVLYPSILNAVSDALLNNDNLMASLAMFFRATPRWSCIALRPEKKEIFVSTMKIRELPLTLQMVDFSNKDGIQLRKQGKSRFRPGKKSLHELSLTTSTFIIMCEV